MFMKIAYTTHPYNSMSHSGTETIKPNTKRQHIPQDVSLQGRLTLGKRGIHLYPNVFYF